MGDDGAADANGTPSRGGSFPRRLAAAAGVSVVLHLLVARGLAVAHLGVPTASPETAAARKPLKPQRAAADFPLQLSPGTRPPPAHERPLELAPSSPPAPTPATPQRPRPAQPQPVAEPAEPTPAPRAVAADALRPRADTPDGVAPTRQSGAAAAPQPVAAVDTSAIAAPASDPPGARVGPAPRAAREAVETAPIASNWRPREVELLERLAARSPSRVTRATDAAELPAAPPSRRTAEAAPAPPTGRAETLAPVAATPAPRTLAPAAAARAPRATAPAATGAARSRASAAGETGELPAASAGGPGTSRLERARDAAAPAARPRVTTSGPAATVATTDVAGPPTGSAGAQAAAGGAAGAAPAPRATATRSARAAGAAGVGRAGMIAADQVARAGESAASGGGARVGQAAGDWIAAGAGTAAVRGRLDAAAGAGTVPSRAASPAGGSGVVGGSGRAEPLAAGTTPGSAAGSAAGGTAGSAAGGTAGSAAGGTAAGGQPGPATLARTARASLPGGSRAGAPISRGPGPDSGGGDEAADGLSVGVPTFASGAAGLGRERQSLETGDPALPRRLAAAALPTEGRVRDVAEAFARRLASRTDPAPASAGFPAGARARTIVDRGLEFLARAQQPDGRWRLAAFAGATPADAPKLESDSAATGLALLSFLGAGHDHFGGPHRDTVRRGLEFLLAIQKPDGDLFLPADPLSNSCSWLYSHGIATLAICEAVGMTGDPLVKPAAERACGFIAASQHPVFGGWRYTPRTDADLSVSGWMLVAVRAGGLAGVPTDPALIPGVRRLLEAASAPADATRYAYNPRKPDQRRSRLSLGCMTAVGAVMRLHTGAGSDDARVVAAARELAALEPAYGSPAEKLRDAYLWYYASQVLVHTGGSDWERWYALLVELLADRQVAAGPRAGSWDPLEPVPDRWGEYGGRIYVTALHLLALEIPDRRLPTDQPH